MSLADSYVENGNPEQGKAYLRKIIDQYPKSSWADTVGHQLQNLR